MAAMISDVSHNISQFFKRVFREAEKNTAPTQNKTKTQALSRTTPTPLSALETLKLLSVLQQLDAAYTMSEVSLILAGTRLGAIGTLTEDTLREIIAHVEREGCHIIEGVTVLTREASAHNEKTDTVGPHRFDQHRADKDRTHQQHWLNARLGKILAFLAQQRFTQQLDLSPLTEEFATEHPPAPPPWNGPGIAHQQAGETLNTSAWQQEAQAVGLHGPDNHLTRNGVHRHLSAQLRHNAYHTHMIRQREWYE